MVEKKNGRSRAIGTEGFLALIFEENTELECDSYSENLAQDDELSTTRRDFLRCINHVKNALLPCQCL